jgi:hypothetical protein
LLVFDPALSFGVYDEVSVAMLEGRSYGPHWAQFLRRLDVQTLFKFSLRSSDMFRVVMAYVQEHNPETCHKDECELGFRFFRRHL